MGHETYMYIFVEIALFIITMYSGFLNYAPE